MLEAAMNVSLTPELDRFVSATVTSGRYTSASEVVREALRLLEERDQDRGAQLAISNQELRERVSSLDRGEHVDPALVRERLTVRSAERKKRRS
jgi:antitoxin ParD1/3/4